MNQSDGSFDVDGQPPEKCLCCGRFLKVVDCSTENGFEDMVICTNPKCKSKGDKDGR